ncbi:MAG TPA: FtsX-like permease family protein, partial [Gemmatimonadales bacterium]|nr:FtsX-like permease family protein [Gemmatimonadales bacterium]
VEAQETIRQVMRGRRGLRASQPDNFSLETSESALKFWNDIKGKLVIAGIILPAIGLIVGAIVIMNIMLVAVAERTREIGIRKALGARRWDIMSQFLVEAATLTLTGGLIGVGVGLLFGALVKRVFGFDSSVPVWSAVVATAASIAIGLVFGLLPANRAARMDPVEALRHE